MNIRLLPIAVAVLILLSFQCSSTKYIIPDKGVIKGTIYSIGNDPFTKLGIHAADGTMYVLKCTKELEKLLSTKQGQLVNLQYEAITSTPEGLVLSVIKIE